MNELDTASSASRQHYIDTGRYLTVDGIDTGRYLLTVDGTDPGEAPNIGDEIALAIDAASNSDGSWNAGTIEAAWAVLRRHGKVVTCRTCHMDHAAAQPACPWCEATS